jgi:integrase
MILYTLTYLYNNLHINKLQIKSLYQINLNLTKIYLKGSTVVAPKIHKDSYMSDRKINFTKNTLLSLPTPVNGRSYYYDTKTRGLSICLLPSGKKNFILYRKIDGRPERIMIGAFPDLSIEQARGKAAELNSLIAKGENPANKHRLIKTEITLGYLFKKYLEEYASKQKSSWREDERQFNCYLSHWKHRKLSDIRKNDIHKLHQKIGNKNGLYAANRLLALLSSLFNRATELCSWDKSNPTLGIKKFPEKSRSRFLQADELPRFFHALIEEPNDIVRDYIYLSLLTGARKSNVLAMRWQEISFETKVWEIPKTKNGESHIIPLVSQALEILKARYLSKQSDWVFPGYGKSGHLVDPKKVWQRILSRAGIDNLRLHDLRRSLGSWQASTGASLAIIGKTLAHKNVNTTTIYARLNIDPVRDSMNKATQAIWEAGNINISNENLNIIKINKNKFA